VSRKVGHFYLCDNFGNSGQIFIFLFTAKFIKDLCKKVELKLAPPLKSAAALYLPYQERGKGDDQRQHG